MARRKGDKRWNQALAIADQEYGPQTSTLLSVLSDLKSQRSNTIRQAESAGRYGTDSERAAQGNIGGAFDGIQSAAGQNTSFLDQLFASPSNSQAGTAIMAAIANSRANLPTNIASAKAHAITESESRGARARSGAEFAKRAAFDKYDSESGRAREQLLALQGRAGNKAGLTYQDLIDKDANRELDYAKFDETKRHNLQMEAKARNQAKKGPRLTPGQRNTFITDVNKALGWVQKLAASEAPGKAIHQLISAGGKTPRKSYIENGQTKSSEGDTVPSFGEAVTRLALDLYYNSPAPGKTQGTLTHKGRKILKDYKVKPPKAWTTKPTLQVGPFIGTAP